MRTLEKEKDIREFLDTLRLRASGDEDAVSETVWKILEDVRRSGDRAVLKYTRRYDDRTIKNIRISASEIAGMASRADAKVMKALEVSARRIRRFHEKQAERSWTYREREVLLGQIVRPIRRVGVYVPGGKAAYPSTVLMNVIPALVAGVPEIAVCVPAPGGMVNPYVMASLKLLGITEAYRIGGAQAIAALAYGTASIGKVDKIVGPGNIFVATAKKMVFGTVDIDMIAGPSEILIIADRSAEARFVAADLLGQAEHDQTASSILLTNSRSLAAQVSREITVQLQALKRKDIAGEALGRYGAIMIVRNLAEAVRISNLIAPEHLEIMTENPFALVPMVENAGAVFLGRWTPEALGDYAAGPNHTLPTGGTARFFSPLGVYDFVKRSSLIGFTRKGFARLAGTVETIAGIEGFEAHANTIRVRKG